MSILALSTRASDYFDLDPRTQINLTLINPVFDREAIDRVFTFPFKLPATPGNLAKLNHANRLDAKITTKYLEVILWIEGQPSWYGELEIGDTTPTDIEVTFKNDALRTVEKMEKLRLRSLTYTETITSNICIETIYRLLYPPLTPTDTLLAIQINGVLYVQTLANFFLLVAAINEDHPFIAAQWTYEGQPANEIGIRFTCLDIRRYSIVVMPEFPHAGDVLYFELYQSTYLDEANRVTTAWDTFLDAEGSTKTKYPIVFAPNIYDAKNAEYSGWVNYTDATRTHPASGDDQTNNPPSQIKSTWLHTLLPFPMLKSLLEKVLEGIGMGLGGSFMADTEIQQLILWSNRPLDVVLPFNDAEVHVYEPNFNIADYLPDITAMELIQALANTFCLLFRVKQGRLLLTPARDLLRAAPEDWTAISEPYIGQTYPSFQPYSLDYERQNDDTKEGTQLQRVDGGPESISVIAPFYTLFYRAQTDYLGTNRIIKTPLIFEKGQSNYFEIANPPTLRLLFYRGLQPDSNNLDYAYASHDRFNQRMDEVGNYSLDWSGPGGLLETWWTEYIRLLTHGKPLRRRVRLTAAHLRDLAEWKSVVKKTVYDELGQTTAVIKSVNVKIGINKISPANVEFVTL